MTADYSVEVCKTLETKFRATRLHRPQRIEFYDAGTRLEYELTSVAGAASDPPVRVRLEVDKFVGGGFAGQVYRVKVLAIDNGAIPGIEVDGIYAMKILIPPSRASHFFRNLLYWLGFQAPFQLQCNPTAARSGALWQKFIKRAAGIRFGSDACVNDIHAIFVDDKLGSCGELSDWVSGRTWRLEVDDHLDVLKRWNADAQFDTAKLGSPEYRAKKTFMRDFVELLNEVGAHEFARQYEWTTCKSQPNCLKSMASEGDPEGGLIAVDFRAGLALLPMLPMSPGDFKLIVKGLLRGSLVQFDRGDIAKLERFVEDNPTHFTDLKQLLPELRSTDAHYRNSIPDVTHNLFRLFYSGTLWSTIRSSAIRGWQVSNLIDEQHAERFRHSRLSTAMFYMLGVVPFLGGFVRKYWGHGAWRRHYNSMLTSLRYFRQAVRGKMAENALSWYRADRVSEATAERVSESSGLFLLHFPLSILPIGIHQFLTSWTYAKERLTFIFLRPLRLYFKTEMREEWLREMVAAGQAKYIINDDEAEVILSKIKEPFIQKYLKSMAVHVCTLPITQVVSIIVAGLYVMLHPELPRATAYGIGIGIIALFQVTPISPGSMARGLYVLYLVIRERNFKDYNIAVFLGFFKYVGYLAFPIQMTYRYPELARFMAGHWATETVHMIPVFGERGALLERWVYCLFYNWPLTISRRMQKRFATRKTSRPRYWHVVLITIVAAGALTAIDHSHYNRLTQLPTMKQIWWVIGTLPLLVGMLSTLGAAGAGMSRRIIAVVIGGMLCGGLSVVFTAYVMQRTGITLPTSELQALAIWRIFAFAVLTPIGTILTELFIRDPDIG
jgi:hypothetical protein